MVGGHLITLFYSLDIVSAFSRAPPINLATSHTRTESWLVKTSLSITKNSHHVAKFLVCCYDVQPFVEVVLMSIVLDPKVPWSLSPLGRQQR